jgi:hypothetical protein
LKLLEAKGLIEQLPHSRIDITVYRRTKLGKEFSIRRFGQEPARPTPETAIPESKSIE